jgi:uncharacterized protein (TIGR03790 family)
MALVLGALLSLFVLTPRSATGTALGLGPSPLDPLVASTRATALRSADLGVIINTSDPLSVAIGEYYATRRHIPAENIARVRFDPGRDDIPDEQFAKLKATVDAKIGSRVQAYALTWARPYRVGCISITSAFAFGLDPALCARGCAPTRRNPYFDHSTSRPYDELHVRPTMAIAALDFPHAKALIDRGVRADRLVPGGTAYLVSSADVARNVRTVEYSTATAVARTTGRVPIKVENIAGALEGHTDILFYFVGSATVPNLSSNRFLAGAIADHLTSFGGMLTDSPQMSSLRWLEAGATGSYGTVVEPCNFLGKFPNVAVVMSHYLAGETLIEAYWKSVEMPGQGIFIGEPLAAPFRKR